MNHWSPDCAVRASPWLRVPRSGLLRPIGLVARARRDELREYQKGHRDPETRSSVLTES